MAISESQKAGGLLQEGTYKAYQAIASWENPEAEVSSQAYDICSKLGSDKQQHSL